MTHLNRIKTDPKKMGGVPIVRDLRIPVATILQLLAEGKTEKEILTTYLELQKEDIQACFEYASYLTKTREIPLSL
ncbi:MAG TPA: DUF433 domain-containing protein [Ignavibacteria bacterium]|nr:DUF433 domain-containing protein [Ignavibacteria bacterium]